MATLKNADYTMFQFGSSSSKKTSYHIYQIAILCAHSISYRYNLIHGSGGYMESMSGAIGCSKSEMTTDVFPTVKRIVSLFQRSPIMSQVGGGTKGKDSSIKVRNSSSTIPKDSLIKELSRMNSIGLFLLSILNFNSLSVRA